MNLKPLIEAVEKDVCYEHPYYNSNGAGCLPAKSACPYCRIDVLKQQLEERDETYKAVCTELAAYSVATLNLKEKLAEKAAECEKLGEMMTIHQNTALRNENDVLKAECEELKAELTKYKKGHDDWQDIRNQGIAEGRREMMQTIHEYQKERLTMRGLINGAYDIVELWKAESPSQKEWRRNWMEQAIKYGAYPSP